MGRTKMQKVTWLEWHLALGGFGVADYKAELKIQKLQTADPI